MHYYQFNIGDYASHTGHLEPLEDIAFRRMIDWCYLHEQPLPEDQKEVAKKIRMRTHSECIASVLQEFFTLENDGYHCKRIEQELDAYHAKSDKARASAQARWLKTKDKSTDANAMRPHSERNANHKPLTTNHKPKDIRRFTPPSIQELKIYIVEKNLNIDPDQFIDFYQSKGWLVGKTKMKDWKAAARNWSKRGNSNGQTSGSRKLTAVERVEAAGREYLEREARDSIPDITPHGQTLGKDG